MSDVVSFEDLWGCIRAPIGESGACPPRYRFPRDAAVRTGAEAVGVFKILAHMGMTEEEETTV